MSEATPSGPLMFQGQKLEPYTPQRHSVALQMGLRFGNVPKEEIEFVKVTVPIEKPKRGGPKTQEIEVPHYAKEFRDALIVVWLRLQKESRLDDAEDDPKAALREMWKWARDHNINTGTPVEQRVTAILYRTMHDARNAQTQPVPRHPGDGSGEPDEED